MDKLHIGVVPEHFSIPFHVGESHGIFAKYNLEVEIVEYARGTGSMCRALRGLQTSAREIEIAVALTEGLVSDLATNGSAFKIVSPYVLSSLEWAIVARPSSSIKSVSDLKKRKFGISRFGSGSHIMTLVLCQREGWGLNDVEFKVCGGLKDLTEAVLDGSVDCFMWEIFMTKNLVDKGELKRIGTILTPWPCFVIAVQENFLESHRDAILRLFQAIRESCLLFKEDKQNSLQKISSLCHLSLVDAEKWFNNVRFLTGRETSLESKQQSFASSQQIVSDTFEILKSTGIIKDPKLQPKEMIAQL